MELLYQVVMVVEGYVKGMLNLVRQIATVVAKKCTSSLGVDTRTEMSA